MLSGMVRSSLVRSFEFAPMSGLILTLTVGLCLLPAAFIAGATLQVSPASPILLPLGIGLAALYGAVWIYSRPTRFELHSSHLEIIWPIRRRRISLSEMQRVRSMSAREFRREYGGTARIGVGGLFGVFGWLWNRKLGLIDVYASRLDGWVVIERTKGHPLIITPRRAEAFVGALSAQL